MFAREIKSGEKIKAESLELNPAPGSIEAGILKQISKQNSYYRIKYTIFLWICQAVFKKSWEWGMGSRE
jgi:hypothetical protein